MTYWAHKHSKFYLKFGGSGGISVHNTFLWSTSSILQKPRDQTVVLKIGWLKIHSFLDYGGNLIGLSTSTFSHTQSSPREIDQPVTNKIMTFHCLNLFNGFDFIGREIQILCYGMKWTSSLSPVIASYAYPHITKI